MKWILILYTLHVVKLSPPPGSNFSDAWANPDNPIKVGSFDSGEQCKKALDERYELSFLPNETLGRGKFRGICVQGNYP